MHFAVEPSSPHGLCCHITIESCASLCERVGFDVKLSPNTCRPIEFTLSNHKRHVRAVVSPPIFTTESSSVASTPRNRRIHHQLHLLLTTAQPRPLRRHRLRPISPIASSRSMRISTTMSSVAQRALLPSLLLCQQRRKSRPVRLSGRLSSFFASSYTDTLSIYLQCIPTPLPWYVSACQRPVCKLLTVYPVVSAGRSRSALGFLWSSGCLHWRHPLAGARSLAAGSKRCASEYTAFPGPFALMHADGASQIHTLLQCSHLSTLRRLWDHGTLMHLRLSLTIEFFCALLGFDAVLLLVSCRCMRGLVTCVEHQPPCVSYCALACRGVRSWDRPSPFVTFAWTCGIGCVE
jgi:hypothetical protein